MKNIIEKYTKYYYIKTIKNISYLFLLFDYLPFKKLNKREYANIDSYYLMSNNSYLKSKNIISELKKININANLTNEINIKQELVKLGVGVLCLNTLCYSKIFGSKFVVQVLNLNCVMEEKLTNNNLVALKCEKCLTLCPNGAITKNKFNKEKCLRFLQENSNLININNYFKMENNLLGCDTCQKCCPMNNNIIEINMPENLKKLLCYENLLKYFIFPEKIKLDFAKYIGNNYARKKYFLKNILCCVANSENKKLINNLKEIEKFVPEDLLNFYYFVLKKLEQL